MGIIILVLRRLPEATVLDKAEAVEHAQPQHELNAKGFPARTAKRGKEQLLLGAKKTWNFMLEAKGLKHSSAINYKIKKIWDPEKKAKPVAPVFIPPPDIEENEAYLLGEIKKFPKNLSLYNKLGMHYIDKLNFSDAFNVYGYLTKHQPQNNDYWARLAYSQLQLEEYNDAVFSYTKSLKLDPAFPNRYFYLAVALDNLKMWNQSSRALLKALELEPDNVKYKQHLSEIYTKLNQPDKALQVSGEIAQFDSLSKNDENLNRP